MTGLGGKEDNRREEKRGGEGFLHTNPRHGCIATDDDWNSPY